MSFAVRLLLVMLLSLGLLLPRVSVMLAEVTGAERVVLCDGSAMVVLALSDDGTPQRIAHEDPCGFLTVDLPPALTELGRDVFAQPVRQAWQRQGFDPARRASRAHGPRAPPARANARA